MNKETLQNYKKLHATVKKIVVEWDPIGVLQSEDWPADEYDSYIPSLCSILTNSSEIATLEAKLNAIVELDMGLAPQRSRNKDFAGRFWKLRDEMNLVSKT
jgi:hypothetical protein